MSKINIIFINTLLIFIILFLLNLYFFIFNEEDYIRFLETYLSDDSYIENPKAVCINMQFLFLIFLLLYVLIYKYFFMLSNFILLNIIDKITIILILLVTFSFHVDFFLGETYTAHKEDHLFETLTAVFSFSASVLFIYSINKVKSYISKSLILFLAISSFFFAMEEISWGQRIFDWKTDIVWQEINYQNETNLHNLLNPIFIWIYPLFNFTIFIFFFKISKYLNRKFSKSDLLLLLPKKESYYYSLIFFFLIFQTYIAYGELTEEILSIVLLSYSIKYNYIKNS